MNIGEAVKAALDSKWGHYGEVVSPVDSARGRTARMNQLEATHGSPKAAAGAVGVSPQTWRRWRKAGQQKPSPGNLKRLDETYRRALLPARRRAAERGLRNAQATVTATINWNGYYNRRPHRTTDLDRMNHTGLITPWLRGDTATLGQLFEDTVGRHYRVVERIAEEEWTGIHFEGNDCRVTFT